MRDKCSTKLSIVIPVHNATETLKECICSVQKQTLCEWEILCTDDGSTDESLQILKDLKRKDERIRLFVQMNQGAGTARNLALRHAIGEFVCFLDADDYFLDSKALETLYNSAVRWKVSVCGGQFYTNYYGDIKAENIYGDLYHGGTEEILVKYSDYQYDYHYQNYIYERKMLTRNHIVFPHYMRVEDTLFFVRAMVAAEVFCIVNIPFYCYRIDDKIVQYKENDMAEYLQGMIENLFFSRQRELKKLHRLIYYRMLDLCRRQLNHYVIKRNEVLYHKLNVADAAIRWEWLEETCQIREHSLQLLLETTKADTMEKWPLPIAYMTNGSRIALYGAGDVGKSYYRQILKRDRFCLCVWVDKNYENITDVKYELSAPEQITAVDFDHIVIGVAEIVAAMEIMDNLAKLQVPASKIIWDVGK